MDKAPIFWNTTILNRYSKKFKGVPVISVSVLQRTLTYQIKSWREVRTTVNDYVISISDVTKSFGHVKALDGLSLDMEPGILGLIGPNGAGKTTLLRILLGLIKPDSGSAQIFNSNTSSDSKDFLGRIGVLHENPYFPPLMTPKQYLTDVGFLYHQRVPADDLLAMVGLSDAADRKTRNLSAGMKRRLGLAQALVGKPELVLLDEPTSNLDITGRDQVLRLIAEIHQEEKVSFLITSHILSELERACHQIAVVVKGKIVEKGSVEELVDKHTQCRFRVMSSDSLKLEKILKEEEGIIDVFVDGSKSVIIEVSPDYVGNIESHLEKLVKGSDVKFFGVENTGTLEDMFRRLIGHE
jgi:ABC-2 type transport system ATP-binding protein